MSSQRYNPKISRTVKRPAKHRRYYVLGALFALLMFAAAITMYLMTVPPADLQQVHFTSPVEREVAARNFEERLQTFEETLHGPDPKPATIELTGKEASAYIQSSPKMQAKLQAVGANNAIVSVKQGRMMVSAQVLVHGQTLPVTAGVTVIPNPDRTLALQIDSIKVGKVWLPRTIINQIQEKFNADLKNGHLDLPPEITQVTVQGEKLIINGAPRMPGN